VAEEGMCELRTVGGGYRLALAAEELDAGVFARQVASGLQASRPEDWVRAREDLAEGLALWRGPALADVAFEDFAQAEIRRLDELRSVALEGRIEADLQLGRHAEVISELEALRSRSPSRERLAGQLMRALHACGRRTDALEIYQRTREHLSHELGLEPSEALAELQRTMLESSLPAPQTAMSMPHNLPVPVTSFIGREDDVDGVRTALKQVRLVTLVGTGGVGKTRLAIEAGQAALGEFPDGVWLVDLTGLSDPKLVPAASANALGVREQAGQPVVETLVNHLVLRRTLIIVDNCEHLIDACAALVDRLLSSCQHVRVLATSREPLNVAGESLRRVRPLTVPSTQNAGSDAAAAESVRLFADRAQAAASGFEVSDENLGPVVSICRRLEGVALAIELAAARLRTMTVTEIASRLDDRFGLLTVGPRTARPRQRTLEATVAWSYDLLAPSEQLLFDRLAVFAGGFSLEAVEHVCADDVLPAGEVLDLTGRLVEQSMVTVEPSQDRRTRYGLLETLRQFGLQKLVERGEAEVVGDRHLVWAAEFAHAATAPEQLDEEDDNLRAALDWAIATGAEQLALRIAARQPRRHFQEYAQRYALLLPPSPAVPAALASEVLLAGGELAFMMGDWATGAERCAAAAAAGRRAGEREIVAYGLTYHGLCLMGMDRDDEALQLCAEGRDEARAAGDRRAEARATLAIAWLCSEFDLQRAETSARAGIRVTDELDDVFDRGHFTEVLGFVLCLQGRFEEAAEQLADAVSLAQRISAGCSAHMLESAAAFAAMTDRLELGGELLGAAGQARAETGDKPRPWERAVRNHWLPQIPARLEPPVYAAATERGRARGFPKALDFAETRLRLCGRAVRDPASSEQVSGSAA
jgi:predicted ATPase/DNA-binding SARP family transcriptional activator